MWLIYLFPIHTSILWIFVNYSIISRVADLEGLKWLGKTHPDTENGQFHDNVGKKPPYPVKNTTDYSDFYPVYTSVIWDIRSEDIRWEVPSESDSPVGQEEPAVVNFCFVHWDFVIYSIISILFYQRHLRH